MIGTFGVSVLDGFRTREEEQRQEACRRNDDLRAAWERAQAIDDDADRDMWFAAFSDYADQYASDSTDG